MKEEQVREIVRTALRTDRYSHLSEDDIDIRGFDQFRADHEVIGFLQHRFSMAERRKPAKAS